MIGWFKKNKGYTSRDVYDIPRFAIQKLQPVIHEYTTWYAEQGISLPDAYSLDPSGWTEVLNKINRAFTLAAEVENPEGELYTARTHANMARVEELHEEIQSGFNLFGKHFFDLKDKYGTPSK